MKLTRKNMVDAFPDEELLFADGFDDAILGVDDRDFRVVYSVKRILEVLQKEGLTQEQSMEHYEYNILGAYVGEKTPIYVFDVFIKS